MRSRFGGDWATQVQGPRPTIKTAENFGFMDGVKVTRGSTLRLEVVEVKARSTDLGGGGCVLAGLEAADYRQQIDAVGAHVVALSAGLSAAGGLRVVGKNDPPAAGRRLLASLGFTPDDDRRWSAWILYNSLQNRLNATFTTPFSALDAAVNADGDPTQTYVAGGPWAVTCRRGRRTTRGVARLVYQVTGKGGASYGCDKVCSDEDEDERRDDVRPEARPGKARPKTRLRDEGDEPEIRDPGQPRPSPGLPPPGGPTPPGERRDAPGRSTEPVHADPPRGHPGRRRSTARTRRSSRRSWPPPPRSRRRPSRRRSRRPRGSLWRRSTRRSWWSSPSGVPPRPRSES